MVNYINIAEGNKMENLYISAHTMIIQHSPKLILLYHTLLRKGVVTNSELYQFLYKNSLRMDNTNTIKCCDISCFSLSECLLDNPAGINISDDLELKTYSTDDFIALLKKYSILVDNNDYISRLGKAENLFDKHHIGNFHQQIGSHLFRQRKGDPEEWWVYQKFNKELSAPKNNPYLWVQKKFMDEFFSNDLSGKKMLDFGCGVGFYSDFFEQKGAEVTGVDPSQLYIDMAESHFNKDKQKKFMVAAFEKVQDFKALGNQKYDMIFMSDVFLYYFEPYKKLDITPAELLCELRKLLTDNGSIYIMDPHGCFHLQPWLGEQAPIIVSAEYKHRKFRVAPNLEEVAKSIEDSGLFIRRLRELYCPETETGDSQNKNVLKEFPLWWFFELKKLAY